MTDITNEGQDTVPESKQTTTPGSVPSGTTGPPTSQPSRKRTDAEGQERLAPQKRANVVLYKDKKPRAVNGTISIGMNKPIEMPSEAQQRAGFYVENPALLINQFPGEYKYAPLINPERQQGAEGANGETNESEEDNN